MAVQKVSWNLNSRILDPGVCVTVSYYGGDVARPPCERSVAPRC